jgi:hypothetical protein
MSGRPEELPTVLAPEVLEWLKDNHFLRATVAVTLPQVIFEPRQSGWGPNRQQTLLFSGSLTLICTSIRTI